MTDPWRDLLRALEVERRAPKPPPYRNIRHDYDTEIDDLRRTQDPARLAVLRYEAALTTLEETDGT